MLSAASLPAKKHCAKLCRGPSLTVTSSTPYRSPELPQDNGRGISRIRDDLFLAGSMDVRPEICRSLGVTHILNVAVECADYGTECGASYMKLPFHDGADGHDVKVVNALASAVLWIHRSIRSPACFSNCPPREDDSKASIIPPCGNATVADDDKIQGDCFDANSLLLSPNAGTPSADDTKRPRKVLVYCQKGVNRSASVVIGYLMAFGEMSLSAAHASVRQSRDVASPSIGFFAALQTLDAVLPLFRSFVRNQAPSFQSFLPFSFFTPASNDSFRLSSKAPPAGGTDGGDADAETVSVSSDAPRCSGAMGSVETMSLNGYSLASTVRLAGSVPSTSAASMYSTHWRVPSAQSSHISVPNPMLTMSLSVMGTRRGSVASEQPRGPLSGSSSPSALSPTSNLFSSVESSASRSTADRAHESGPANRLSARVLHQRAAQARKRSESPGVSGSRSGRRTSLGRVNPCGGDGSEAGQNGFETQDSALSRFGSVADRGACAAVICGTDASDSTASTLTMHESTNTDADVHSNSRPMSFSTGCTTTSRPVSSSSSPAYKGPVSSPGNSPRRPHVPLPLPYDAHWDALSEPFVMRDSRDSDAAGENVLRRAFGRKHVALKSSRRGRGGGLQASELHLFGDPDVDVDGDVDGGVRVGPSAAIVQAIEAVRKEMHHFEMNPQRAVEAALSSSDVATNVSAETCATESLPELCSQLLSVFAMVVHAENGGSAHSSGPCPCCSAATASRCSQHDASEPSRAPPGPSLTRASLVPSLGSADITTSSSARTRAPVAPSLFGTVSAVASLHMTMSINPSERPPSQLPSQPHGASHAEFDGNSPSLSYRDLSVFPIPDVDRLPVLGGDLLSSLVLDAEDFLL